MDTEKEYLEYLQELEAKYQESIRRQESARKAMQDFRGLDQEEE
jgi:hypothetical protein